MDKIPIYWINLERSPSRKSIMENQFIQYNITNHQRIEGIDGKNLEFSAYKDKCENITVYELACTLSHLKAIETAYNNGDEYALIFEDDCTFEYIKYQKYSIVELIEKMNNDHKDWNILQLCTCGRIDHCERMRDNSNLIERRSRDCATAYLINKSGMNQLLQCNNRLSQSDTYLYKYCKTYCITKPYFSYQFSNIFKSSVHNQGANSNQTIYKREDENKRFWDNYYLSLK
jgi:GR25 family glycosyltransferase involved in LPS biosynthesis